MNSTIASCSCRHHALLDATALIVLVDGEAPWATATQATLQQLAAQSPDLALAVSRLSLLECRGAPLRRGATHEGLPPHHIWCAQQPNV